MVRNYTHDLLEKDDHLYELRKDLLGKICLSRANGKGDQLTMAAGLALIGTDEAILEEFFHGGLNPDEIHKVREEARRIGISTQNRLHMAFHLRDKVDLEDLSLVTGLTVEQIKSITHL